MEFVEGVERPSVVRAAEPLGRFAAARKDEHGSRE